MKSKSITPNIIPSLPHKTIESIQEQEKLLYYLQQVLTID